MKNIQKMFEYNNERTIKIDLYNSRVWYNSSESEFSGETIKRILWFANSLHKRYRNIKIPIVFNFGRVKVVDKLSYVLFECICYSLINDYGHSVTLFIDPIEDIYTEGIYSSPLLLLNDHGKDGLEKYLKSFNMDIYNNHYRRIIKGSNKEDTNYLGGVFKEIDSFLKIYGIDKIYREEISELISELVGNACEHGEADCLVDVDITRDYLKKIHRLKQPGDFYGINIAIINFSDILLGDGIKNKLQRSTAYSNKDVYARYYDLISAYDFHKSQFDNDYTKEDFFNIASLQDKISGREKYTLSGGTGLTLLIRSLQEKSDQDTCYVISGNRSVLFEKDYLSYSEDNWLAFNENGDFFGDIPSADVVTECLINMPGTAYNLNFIIKREEKINE